MSNESDPHFQAVKALIAARTSALELRSRELLQIQQELWSKSRELNDEMALVDRRLKYARELLAGLFNDGEYKWFLDNQQAP